MSQNIASAPEIIIVPNNANEVCCDGGLGALGHPVVYYSFDAHDVVECSYCDRQFVKERAKNA